MATDIVASLFGVTPEMYQQRQMAQADERALQYAQLTPFQQANYAISRGAYGLAGALGGALGAQDPQLQLISQRNAIARQIDPTNLESMRTGIRALVQAGDQVGAMQLSQILQQRENDIALRSQREAAAGASLAQAAKSQAEIDEINRQRRAYEDFLKSEESGAAPAGVAAPAEAAAPGAAPIAATAGTAAPAAVPAAAAPPTAPVAEKSLAEMSPTKKLAQATKNLDQDFAARNQYWDERARERDMAVIAGIRRDIDELPDIADNKGRFSYEARSEVGRNIIEGLLARRYNREGVAPISTEPVVVAPFAPTAPTAAAAAPAAAAVPAAAPAAVVPAAPAAAASTRASIIQKIAELDKKRELLSGMNRVPDALAKAASLAEQIKDLREELKPTEIAKLEREIDQFRADGVPDTDPRIKTRLDKIVKLSAPTSERFGEFAERVAMAEYDKPFGQLTQAQRKEVNRLVEEGKGRTAEKGAPKILLPGQPVEPKDWLKFEEFIEKQPTFKRTASIVSAAPSVLRTIRQSTSNDFAARALPSSIARLFDEGVLSNNDVRNYAITGGLDDRLASMASNFFTGKVTSVTKQEAERFMTSVYRGALIDQKEAYVKQAKRLGYADSPNYLTTIQQLDEELAKFKLMTPQKTPGATGTETPAAPARTTGNSLVDKYLNPQSQQR